MVVVTFSVEEMARHQARDRLPLRARTERVRACTADEDGSRRLVALATEGDEEALQLLCARYSPRVYSFLLPIIRDQHETEDVTQLVFIRLLAKLHLYRPGQASFESWLMKVARNVALDHLRRRRAIPSEMVERGEAGGAAGAGLARSLLDAIDSLPADQRSVVILRHVVGLSPGEIATRLGRTEPSVHGLHNRARSALRAKLCELDCLPSVSA